jgi:drug/metabolite transporter (DMT)-like permease
VALVLALFAAGCYGAADFLGGFATKRAPTLAVVVLSQLAGVATVLVVQWLLPLPSAPRPVDLAWGAAAGVAGGSGLALFYQGLARGTMSVIAPITAVAATAVPVICGLALGDRPSVVALVGVALSLLAVVLVSGAGGPSASPGDRRPIQRAALLAALAAGTAFGAFYVLIHNAAPAAGVWPLAAARTASMTACLLFALATRRSLVAPRASLPVIALTGALDMAANICFLLAVQRGHLSIVGAVASLYPAATIVLARVVLGERLGAVQHVGLGVAGVAVVLISVG